MNRKNKYHCILEKILCSGKVQENRKGKIHYLLNERLTLTPSDLLEIFEGHNLARKKLKNELELFTQGERNVDKYREAGITWWDYCGQTLVNSYPTYLERLPRLVQKINTEKRNSKKLRAFPWRNRCGKQSGTLPKPCSIPNRRGRTGRISLPAQFGCQFRIASRHLSSLSNIPPNRHAAKIHNADFR